VHRRDQTEQVPDAAVVEAVDLADVAGLPAALESATVGYYIPPAFSRQEERFGANVVSAATAAKLPRLVYHSVLHAATPAMPHHQRKAMVELRLRESTLCWTIVQPAMYAQTPLAFLDTKRRQMTVGFDPRRQFTPVDLADLAEAVATVLLDNGHEYATYELAGAEVLSFAEMASAIGQAMGAPVSVRTLPSTLVAAVAGRRLGASATLAVKAMLDHYDRHGLVGNSNVLRMLLGREPHHFAETMHRELGAAHRAA
jgi:uncharacterized protein YbjT (DUF2867 family)